MLAWFNHKNSSFPIYMLSQSIILRIVFPVKITGICGSIVVAKIMFRYKDYMQRLGFRANPFGGI